MGQIPHKQAMEESEITKEAALAIAADASKWPTRRYRVESQGIRSRLLTEAMAGRIRNERGGKIVEIIPKNREAAGLPSRRRGKYVDLPACERCKVAAGKPCVRAGGTKTKTHRARLATPATTEPERTPSA